MKRSKAIFYNLILLTFVTLGMRFVSLGFNVYITGKLGAQGVGLYSLIMSVGGFAVTFATSGVNLGSSMLTAQALGRGSEADVRRAMIRCIAYSLFFGLTGCAAMYALASPISIHILGDRRCILPLKILSFALPFISLSSALSGYFTAVRRVFKNAAVQVCQQLFNILLTVRFIALLLPKGLEYACVAVILGSAVSEAFAFLCSFTVWRVDLHKHNKNKGEKENCLGKKLLSISLPVALSAYVRSGLVSVEHILIPKGLKKYGAGNSAALASYGVLHGMAMPIVLFPMALISAFAGLLVPEIAGSVAAGENKRIENIVSRSLRLTLLFGVGCAGVLAAFGNTLGIMIYKDANAGTFIRIMAPLIPVMYFDHIVDGMLKGLGEQLYSMRVNIFDAFMSVVLVYFLVPEWGIFGYAFIIYAMEIVNTALSVTRLVQRCDVKLSILNWVVKPLASIIAASSLEKIISRLLPVSNTVVSICITLILYILFLRISSSFDNSDIMWFKNAIK
ncbi:MAG: polysaccharide biosynthesis protein [Clostridia bacterium]|nr:polysaccharide biosynthesis protein [Clostridia bacterium]